MAKKVEYKFKPYKPTNLKMAKPSTELANLQKQRDNLEERLRAEGVNPETLGGEFDNRNFLQKAFNTNPESPGFLMDFFEVINRPTEAIKAAIDAGLDGQDVLEAAWEGLSGERITMGGDLLEKMGVDFGDSPVAEFVEDVAADIVLDPLNLLPSGYFLKKFGGLFMRNKSKLIKQFTGRVLKTFSKITKLDGTQAVFNNLDELADFLKNANADELANIQRQFDAIVETTGETGEIYARGTRRNATDKDFWSYGNTFEELKERTERLIDMRDKINAVEDAFNKGRISLDERVQQIEEILPSSFSRKKVATRRGVDIYVRQIKQEVLTELDLYSDAMEVAKRYGDDFDVILNKTGNRVDDVVIVKKLKVGDKDYYVTALAIEAKTAEDFYLKTATLVFEGGQASFTQSQRAFNFSEPLRERMKQFMQKRIQSGANAGRTLNEVFDDYVNGRVLDNQGNARKSFRMAEELDDASKEELKSIIIDMYKEGSDGGPIWFKQQGQKGFLLDVDTARQYINIDNMTIGFSRSNNQDQLRLLGFAGLDLTPAARDGMSGLEALIADGKAYGIEGLIEQAENLQEVERTARVNIFEYYQDREGLIGDFSKVGVKFINFMKDKFAAYGFLTPELTQAARRLKGETAVQYQLRMLRLAGLRESFQKQFPNISDRYLSQLIESGARIENGALVFADRTITLKDYLRTLIDASENGNPGMLRKFAAGKEQEFVDKLNEVGNAFYRNTGSPEVLFFVEEVNGVKVLKTNVEASDLKRMLRDLDSDDILGIGVYKDDVLDYGKYNQVEGSQLRLSADAERIATEWEGYAEFQNLHHDVQRMLVEEGGFTNLLSEAGQLNDTYLRHTMTKQAYEYLSKNRPGVLSRFAKPGSEFFKQRKYLGTIEEVNDYLMAIYNLDMEVFDPSAFRSAEDFFKQAFRNVEQGKLMELLLAGKDKYGEGLLKIVDNLDSITRPLKGENVIFTSFKEEFPQLMKNLSQRQQDALIGYLAGQGFETSGKALVMNKTIHRVMKESERAFKSLDDLTKFYDGFLNTWKGLTLVTPGFHLRNLFGNMFNSYVAGMDTFSQLKYTRIAMLEIDGYQKAVKLLAKGTQIDDLPKNLRKAYDNYIEFANNGLVQSHRGVRDLESLKEASELAGKGNLKGAKKLYNDVIRANFNFAEKMDDTQRYILYRWGLDKTGDSVQAAKIVTDSLFDYSALTTFEKDVMKRLFPFYTFMKNNFIFHAKNILANPKMYARAGRAYKYYLEDIAGYTIEDLPDYAAESMWLPIPMMITKNDKEGITFLKANLPITDFVELVQNPFEKGVQSVTVPVKLAIEIGAGRDMFTGQPITRFPGEKDVMEEDTGVLSSLRNERGQLTVFQTPLAQKIANDIGLRTPLNFGTAALDIVDTLTGYQGPSSGLADFMERAGIASVQDTERMQIIQLYQDLEQLRNLKRLYEQETGNQLPVLPRR